MLKRLGIVCGLLAATAFVGAAAADHHGNHEHACCAKAKANDAWCGNCKIGFFADESMQSEKLHKALQGKKVDVAMVKCDGCKKAIATNGKCEECDMYVVKGVVYKSPVSYKLMSGEAKNPEECAAKCKGCGEACKNGGWCEGCEAGFVAGRMYKGKDDYKAAKEAHMTLANAIKAAKKCEACAVAMVTDGTCGQCKVSFEDGKKKAA